MEYGTDTRHLTHPQEQVPVIRPVHMRRRAPVACRTCNRRKVRCNVAVSNGGPCANCVADSLVCETTPRKKRISRKKAFEPSVAPGDRHGIGDAQSTSPNTAIPSLKSPPFHTTESSGFDTSSQSLRPVSNAERVLEADDMPERASTGIDSERDEGDNSHAFAVALDLDIAPAADSSLFYSGDKSSALRFLSDICHPDGPKPESHLLVPRASKKTKDLDDLWYLRSKGAFSAPSTQLCDELISSYFRHVHPLLPVVDARSFLRQYLEYGYQNLNLLLLWSMFLAAANFVEPDVLEMSGYKTRKSMKRAMYQRAKCLYDSDYEVDQIAQIQSVILLGFWYTDTEDRSGAWHWIGIAIGLCQTLGLHRSAESLNVSTQLPETRRRLFRRIWWSCVVRDRWLSLVKGRPMRINLEDCDVQLPSIDDIVEEINAIPVATRDKYIPYRSDAVARLWQKLVAISVVLGNILRVHYRIKGPKPSGEEIEKSEDEMEECRLADEDLVHENPVMQVFAYQLRLFYEAAVVVLYRPYVLRGPVNYTPNSQSVWQKRALGRARAAAANTNMTLEACINMDMVRFLKPMTITSLIPAMQIHLLDCKMPSALARRLGNLKLQLCMMTLSELRDTYWGADFTYRMFERAQAKLSEVVTPGAKTTPASGLHHQAYEATFLPLTPESTALSQIQSSQWSQCSYPSLDDILAPEFCLGDGQYSFGMTEPDNSSGQDLNGDYGLNSLLSSDEFNGFCLDTNA